MTSSSLLTLTERVDLVAVIVGANLVDVIDAHLQASLLQRLRDVVMAIVFEASSLSLSLTSSSSSSLSSSSFGNSDLMRLAVVLSSEPRLAINRELWRTSQRFVFCESIALSFQFTFVCNAVLAVIVNITALLRGIVSRLHVRLLILLVIFSSRFSIPTVRVFGPSSHFVASTLSLLTRPLDDTTSSSTPT